MGIYLNPGKDDFQMAVNSEIFVDKTEMVRYLNSVVNTQQRFVSVSRPRRFGKTMAADMVCAYYGRGADSGELFSQRRLAKAQAPDGGRLQVDASSHQNDMTTFHGRDDVLSPLVHLGYLGYDDGRREVFVPNREIMDEFRTSTKGPEWADAFEQFRASQELLLDRK